MRVVALLLFAVTAAAEPRKIDLPTIVKEAQSPSAPVEPDAVLGMFGAVAAAIIIEPPPHPDARPYPLGAVIVPPDPNDPMILEPGTNQLRHREPRAPWWPRDWSRRLKTGADRVWDVMLPEL